MQDILLFLAVAAALVFGYFVIRRLDRFLAQHGQTALQPRSGSLRIGLSDPLAADGLSEILAAYAEAWPEADVDLFSSTDDALLRALEARQLDVAFLSADIENPSEARYDGMQVLLARAPVVTQLGGAPVMPLSACALPQNALWPREQKSPPVRAFLACLTEWAAP